MNQEYDYQKILNNVLQHKQKINPRYSLRAFAKYLKCSPGYLSKIMNGINPMSLKDAEKIVQTLKLDPIRTTEFINSVNYANTNLKILSNLKLNKSNFENLEREIDNEIVLNWEYFAIYALVDLKDYVGTPEWISERLSIPIKKAISVLDNMVTRKLLVKDNQGMYILNCNSHLFLTSDIGKKVYLQGHLNDLEHILDLAYRKNEQNVDFDMFKNTTIPVDSSKLKQANKLIEEFQLKLCKLLESGTPDSVYRFSSQFLKLTSEKDKSA